MRQISSSEFHKNFGQYQDLALVEPLILTRNGRERLAVLSASEFRRLQQLDRQILHVSQLTLEDAEPMLRHVPDESLKSFDDELE